MLSQFEPLLAMKHSPIHNYVIPGLTSWLLADPTTEGVLRLFECSREHEEAITPHSHRFDLTCHVLEGSVRNILWKTRTLSDGQAGKFEDLFTETTMAYDGSVGEYAELSSRVVAARRDTRWYGVGESYSMLAHEIHSIRFSKGAKVVLIEGPVRSLTNVVLEPYEMGFGRIKTMRTEPWMFRRPGLGQLLKEA